MGTAGPDVDQLDVREPYLHDWKGAKKIGWLLQTVLRKQTLIAGINLLRRTTPGEGENVGKAITL